MKKAFFKWLSFAWAAKWLSGLRGGKDEGSSKAGTSGGFVFGAFLGAGLMYFLDPSNGARRRAFVRDKLVKGGHEVEDFAQSEAKYYKGKAEGVVAEAKSRAQGGSGEVSDDVLVDRVRSELGHHLSNAGAVDVTARGGKVTLSGRVGEDERGKAVSATEKVQGVEEVVDAFDSSDSVSGAQK